ncbi:MAG: MFS transporter [Actinobacteria bacterium]|nr:MFS transporter [Actinomycetota bacterium]MBU1864964.1 MFS transporter [Actinomycetota bacterium]
MSRRSPSPAAVLAVVSFGVFIAADDLTVAATMLRQIIGDLGIPLPEGLGDAAWIVNAYLVAYVAVMPFMGRLSDVVGRRRVFTGALAVFLIGSIWVAQTDTLGWFIGGRVLTAIGGGAMVPVALAVISDVYEERRRPAALGVLSAVDTIGWVWGPLFGAMLVRFLDWRWQFHLNVPLALIGMAAAWWVLREHDRPSERRRMDWPAAAALSAALVGLNVALLNTGQISGVGDLAELADLTGTRSFPMVPVIVASAAALGLFLWLELRSRDPLIDLRLFALPNVSAALAINFLAGAVLVVAMVDVPLFVNLVVETDLKAAAVTSGWVLSALTAAMAVAAYLGGLLTEWSWYRPVIMTGLVMSGTGFALMGWLWSPATGPWVMAGHLALLGAGFGLLTAPTNAAVVDAVPAERRGVGGGLVILARLLGLAVGLSGLTAWFLHRFEVLRSTLDLPPASDPGYRDALDAARASVTASALGETFVFAAALVVVAGLVSLGLRRRPSRITS